MTHSQPNPYAPDAQLKVWLDGELVPAEQAKISVWDHGLLYGDGVFEGTRVYNKNIFACDEHVQRFTESARAIKLTLPVTAEEIKTAMRETCTVNQVEDGYIRLVATRGVGTLGLSPKFTANPTVIIIASTIALYPEEKYETGLALITSSITRNHPNSVSPRIKSLNYLNSVLAKIECHSLGADEAVLLNHEGHIAECSGDNIFLIKNRELCTPDVASGILAGITRGVAIQLAHKRNLPVHECRLTRYDLYAADEIFLTGTAAEIIAATSIDGRPVGSGRPGEITRMLQQDYIKLRTS